MEPFMVARNAPQDRAVGVWLLLVCASVALMILVGGATRLTDSGLSITEWDLGKGLAPPLTLEAWEEEFALYRQTAEYQLVNQGMSLGEFQYIYFWEWGHRFLGKMIGLIFALPFFVFLWAGRLRGRLLPTTLLFALGGLQGFVGWWMVTSGLGDADRVDVSSVRLAVHLGMAFAIIGLGFMLALQALGAPARGLALTPRWAGLVYLKLLFAQIILGALVAGIDAGRAAWDWPTMGGEWFPSSYAALDPFARNLIENGMAAQFNHRVLGYLTMVFGLWIAVTAWLKGAGTQQALGCSTALLLVGQVALGVVTVLHHAPLLLCLIHQAGAVALWLSSIALVITTPAQRQPDTVATTQAPHGLTETA
jgi:cytochrome c oxidase assembly protein subunit 15